MHQFCVSTVICLTEDTSLIEDAPNLELQPLCKKLRVMKKGNSLIEDTPLFGRFHEQFSSEKIFVLQSYFKMIIKQTIQYKSLCLLCSFDC